MRHKKKLIAGVVLLIGIATAIPTTARHLRAASVLARFADPHDTGKLANFERHPIDEKPFCFSGEQEQLCGRLYVPGSVVHPPGIVLLHGVHWLGIDEPRLVTFARALSASGVTVFTPPVKELADFRISPVSRCVILTSIHRSAVL